MIKISTQINKQRKTIERSNKTERWSFEKINKIDETQIEKKREKTQVSKIRNERADIAMDFTEI